MHLFVFHFPVHHVNVLIWLDSITICTRMQIATSIPLYSSLAYTGKTEVVLCLINDFGFDPCVKGFGGPNKKWIFSLFLILSMCINDSMASDKTSLNAHCKIYILIKWLSMCLVLATCSSFCHSNAEILTGLYLFHPADLASYFPLLILQLEISKSNQQNVVLLQHTVGTRLKWTYLQEMIRCPAITKLLSSNCVD